MINEILIGVVTAGGFFLLGLIIQILSQNYKDKKEHERIKEKLRKELILKEKIESFKKIHKIIYVIKLKLIGFVLQRTNPEEIKDLILELSNESFLFSNKKTIIGIKESINFMHNILDTPPKIIEKIENNKIEINKEEYNKTIKQISETQTKIIMVLRKELQI